MSAERKRDRGFGTTVFFPKIIGSAGGEAVKPSSSTLGGRQVTVSENHVRGRDGRYHEGGPFFTFHSKARPNPMHVVLKGTGQERYSGPALMPKISTIGTLGLPTPGQDSSFLDPVGAEAIHAIDPTNPNAQLGVTLGEFLTERRLSVPGVSTWKRRTEVAKAAAGEYLAAQFGWLPLVDEVKSTAQSIRDGNTIMENYRAHAGRNVYREFAFPDTSTTVEEELGTSRMLYSAIGTRANFNTGTVRQYRVRTITERRWFAGSFTYHNGSSSTIQKCLGVNSEIDKLFGLTLTPDVLWELTPWSWAVDWFSNTGSVISNVTSFGINGLVMRYGYVMAETVISDSYHMEGTGLKGYPDPPPSPSVITTVKRRREANPFGFGVSWDGLSPTQLAITAALGITRLR